LGVIKSSSLVRSPGIPDAEEGLTKSRNKRPQVVYAQCCRRLFHCQNKIERDQIWQHFSVLFTLSPKQSNRKGGARAVDLPARSFDLASPGVAPPLKRGGVHLYSAASRIYHLNSAVRHRQGRRSALVAAQNRVHGLWPVAMQRDVAI